MFTANCTFWMKCIAIIYVVRRRGLKYAYIGSTAMRVSVCIDLRIWQNTWWHHEMETFSALLVICAGNAPVPGEIPTQRPVTRSFDVYFDLCLNKRSSKQSWGWWFETQSHPLWRHRNDHTWNPGPSTADSMETDIFRLDMASVAMYHQAAFAAVLLTCQSQSGVSLSLHLGSKIKIYLWPQKQLDVDKYRL